MATKAGKEESRCSKKDDEEICRDEVGQEDCGEARSRHGACQEGQGRHISGTQADRHEGGRHGACQKAGCSGGSRNAGPTSRAEAVSPRRAEPVSAAAESRRSGARPNRTAEARRAAAASGSSCFACGAEARNAGRTSRTEAGSRRLAESVTCCR
jgi:hypothetical protein